MGRDMPEKTENAEAPVWDDEKFIARVKELAEARQMSLAEVSRRADLAEDYFVKRRSGRGRNVTSIVHLAGALGVPVSELIDPPSNPPPVTSKIDPVKLERLATVANVAAHLYLVLDGRRATLPEDIDAEELLELLMRFVEPRHRRSKTRA